MTGLSTIETTGLDVNRSSQTGVHYEDHVSRPPSRSDPRAAWLGARGTGAGSSRSASCLGRPSSKYFPRLPSLEFLPYHLNTRREWLTTKASRVFATRKASSHGQEQNRRFDQGGQRRRQRGRRQSDRRRQAAERRQGRQGRRQDSKRRRRSERRGARRGEETVKPVARDDSHLPTGRNMSTILLVIILILIFGGGGGYYAHGRYGGAGLGGVLGIVLIVLVVLWLVGR